MGSEMCIRDRHLAEFFSGRSWAKIGPGSIFFGVFEKFETFFSKICAHSERYRNLFAGIFEIRTFYGKKNVPIVTGLSVSVYLKRRNAFHKNCPDGQSCGNCGEKKTARASEK